MSLIFFQPSENGMGDRLRKILETVVPKDRIEMHRTMDDLCERLQKPICHAKVAVLVAATKKDMGRLLHLRDLLAELKLVLVLPDDSAEMVAEAHALSPRYITWADSDFSDIASVLRRLIVLSEDRFDAGMSPVVNL